MTEDCDLRDGATINLDAWEIEIMIESSCDDFRDAMENEKVPRSIITKVILGVPRKLLSELTTKDFWARKDFWEYLEFVRCNLRSARNEKKHEIKMSEVHQKKNVESEVDEGTTKMKRNLLII